MRKPTRPARPVSTIVELDAEKLGHVIGGDTALPTLPPTDPANGVPTGTRRHLP